MSQRERLIAGAMSGTSADGVDVAITKISGHGMEMQATLIRHDHLAYSSELRAMIFKMRESGIASLSDLAKLGQEISLTYARAVNESLTAARINASDLSAIAAHGQTLYHDPPNTIQWLDPALIAAKVGCAVVSDFRRADLAAGGQGAPLVPFADYILFRHPTKNRVLLNIGGIANLTWLKAGGTPNDVIAFDTGPGNCISDWICRTHGPFGLSWDADGAGASRGRVLCDIEDQFIRAAFIQMAPPKSTDGPAMITAFEETLAVYPKESPEINDLLATASRITASTIYHGIRRLPGPVDELIVSGGGTLNKAIMGWLKSLLSDEATIKIIDDLNVVAAAKEALAFALLGAATLNGVPSNLPSVTGAGRAVVLGSITPKP